MFAVVGSLYAMLWWKCICQGGSTELTNTSKTNDKANTHNLFLLIKVSFDL